jgi:DNA-binding NarL/FixJ family response regulator
VLVVDDQPEWCRLTELLLQDHPDLRLVGIATSGEEALDLLPALRPQVAIVDVEMGDMSGFHAVRRMQKLSPGLCTILVSSEDSPEFARIARIVGAAGFICKKALSAQAVLRLVQAHRQAPASGFALTA